MHSYSVPNDNDDNYARIIVHHYINPDCKINDTGIFYIKDTYIFKRIGAFYVNRPEG